MKHNESHDLEVVDAQKRQERSKWPIMAFVGSMTLAASLITVAFIREANNDDNEKTTPTTPKTEQTTKSTPTTEPDPLAFTLPKTYHTEFSDYHQIDCQLQEVVTVKSPSDLLFNHATEGLGESSFIFGYVFDANRRYNSEHLGLSEEDFTDMGTGEKFAVIANCVLTGPLVPGLGEDGNPGYWRDYQETGRSYRYDGVTGELIYCVPQPECEENPPIDN